MTWYKEVWIMCDEDGCLADYGPNGRTATATRRRAREEGWVYRDGEDYCPEHA